MKKTRGFERKGLTLFRAGVLVRVCLYMIIHRAARRPFNLWLTLKSFWIFFYCEVTLESHVVDASFVTANGCKARVGPSFYLFCLLGKDEEGRNLVQSSCVILVWDIFAKVTRATINV